METKLQNYENWIAQVCAENGGHLPSELLPYHTAMVRNFQHERLIHLLVTFFFVILTIISIIAGFILAAALSEMILLVPIIILSGIFAILTAFYIKHYYFLENHVQALYKFFRP